MIAFDAGIALSMADFTRYSKSQKSQILGQVISAPLITCFISFVGICGTAGAAIAFNEAIWEPAVLKTPLYSGKTGFFKTQPKLQLCLNYNSSYIFMLPCMITKV